MKLQMPYKDAKFLADRIVDILKPSCDKIIICGSIRREKAIIGDIEICCLPKLTAKKQDNTLFDTDLYEKYSVSEEFTNAVLSLGKITKGKTSGRYLQITESNFELQLDLFMPEEELGFFRQVAVNYPPTA